jgi:hypothetical protein
MFNQIAGYLVQLLDPWRLSENYHFRISVFICLKTRFFPFTDLINNDIGNKSGLLKMSATTTFQVEPLECRSPCKRGAGSLFLI